MRAPLLAHYIILLLCLCLLGYDVWPIGLNCYTYNLGIRFCALHTNFRGFRAEPRPHRYIIIVVIVIGSAMTCCFSFFFVLIL